MFRVSHEFHIIHINPMGISM